MITNLKALFLDMDGVLWRDLVPIGDLKANLAKIEKMGLKTVFITNNATRSKEHYVRIFDDFGVKIAEQQIYTSANSTANHLAEKWPDGGKVYVIGESGLLGALAERGFEHSDKDVLAVVAALDRNIDYQKLSTASLLIQQGAPLIGTNPDKTLPSPEGLVPGAGAIIAALESASGVQAEIIGKPQASMIMEALADLEIKPTEAMMIGDRLETDIAAGQNAGCLSGLVLSGASSAKDHDNWPTKADFVAKDLGALLEQLA